MPILRVFPLLAEATVAKYMTGRGRRPPSQTWRTFLRNHLCTMAACDFFRRRILHFNVTAHPTSAWTAQPIREAFPGDGTGPRYLLRDRDGAYGDELQRVVRGMGIREILTAPQSPWQNPYAKKEFVLCYNESRPHLGLDGNSPAPRYVEPPGRGPVVAVPVLGGLHHCYRRPECVA